MTLIQEVSRVVLIGAGATAVMDVWLMLLKRMGVQTLNFAFVGRWVGHILRGRFVHRSIGDAAPVRGELCAGWVTHYAVGVVFSGLLAFIAGTDWMRNPTLAPALAVGALTVVVPLFVMQPAMGSGFAASKTKTPVRNCIRSVINHSVFGLGLYLSACFITLIAA